MNEIKCMIVDDEPIARDILRNHITATPGLSLVKSCMNASEAYGGLHEHEVDLMFLDIQMPVITGTDFLRSLRNPPLVVFTTAYQNYAMEGFELNSVDYLLKPITYERFYQAIQKVRDRLTIQPAQQAAPVVDYIFIKQDSRLVRIHFDQIRYVEAEKDFSTVFTTDKKLLAGMHLKMFESMLPADRFFRVHRSFIVNLSKISSINGNMVEIGQTEIPIGANYKNELMKKLGIAG
ncbi:response regulator [Niastella caeni]|uniref:Response regulator n=1 Tax=Niastella caeni TaxID=2569763 RepID=A0A4S8HWH5_9BACT|nr:response regulator transcription factor [Niastella caeni]THU39581.1 response regulator [Niastella caeni]